MAYGLSTIKIYKAALVQAGTSGDNSPRSVGGFTELQNDIAGSWTTVGAGHYRLTTQDEIFVPGYCFIILPERQGEGSVRATFTSASTVDVWSYSDAEASVASDDIIGLGNINGYGMNFEVQVWT